MNFPKLIILPSLLLLASCTAQNLNNSQSQSSSMVSSSANYSVQASQPSQARNSSNGNFSSQSSNSNTNTNTNTNNRSNTINSQSTPQFSNPGSNNQSISDRVFASDHDCMDLNFEFLLLSNSAKEVEDSLDICLQNPNIRYQFAQALFQQGFVEESLNQLKLIPASENQTSSLVLLETSDLVKRMDSPFVYAAEVANRKLEQWLTRPSEVPEFAMRSPVRKNPPTPPVVVRSEFETTQEFNLRKRTIEQDYLTEVNQLELEYQQAIEDYNNNVERYNAALEWEIRSRRERAEMMRNEFLITEIRSALGRLLIDNLNYNADEQIYFADLISTESNYTAPIVIEVPLEDARNFKNDYQGIFPEASFEMTNGTVSIGTIRIPYDGKVYRASITDRDYDFEPNREVISLQTMQDLNVNSNAPNEKMLRNQININSVINENRRFFQNVIN